MYYFIAYNIVHNTDYQACINCVIDKDSSQQWTIIILLGSQNLYMDFWLCEGVGTPNCPTIVQVSTILNLVKQQESNHW